MPIEEKPDCDPSKQARVEYSPLAHAVCLSDLPWKPHESPAAGGGPGAPEGFRGS